MSFQIALSGLNAASNYLSVTSNNIANANSTGFKGGRAEFADVFAAGAQGIGSGVQLSTVRQNFGQGSVEFTQRPLDLAISGEGFFVLNDNGGELFSRAGQFGVDSDGYVGNAQGQRLQAYPPLSGGGFNTGSLFDLRLAGNTNAPVASTEVAMGVNLPANAQPPIVSPFDPTNANTFNNSTSTTVFDTLGASHTASYYFIKGAADGEWEVAMTIDGAVAGPPSSVIFDSTGQITTPAAGEINMPPVNPGNGADPITLDLVFDRTTQFGDTFSVNSLNPDGSSAGRLKGIEIDTAGVVFARFTNGSSEALGKLALANFPNAEGLDQVGDNSWLASFASGEAVRGEANTSSYGIIQAGALESSNIDLTEELVSMITAQRSFQANAQVISIMDQVNQSIINIR